MLRIFFVVLLGGMVAGLTVAGEPTAREGFEWPHYKGDAGFSGLSPDDSVKPPLRLVWSYRLDGDASNDAGGGPIVGGNKVFVPVYNTRSIVALDAHSGHFLWEHDDYRAAIRKVPTYYQGRLYVWNREPAWNRPAKFSIVSALDADTGEKIWERELKPDGSDPHKAGVAVADGKVYVSEGGDDPAVIALDADTGRDVWRTALGTETGTAVVTPAVAGGRVFVGTLSDVDFRRQGKFGAVTALDAADGKLLWRRTEVFPYKSLSSDGRVVACPMATEAGRSFYLLDAATGETLWSGPERYHYAPATIADEVLLIKPYGRQLIGHDRRSGEKLWEFDGKVRSGCCSPVVSGKFAYLGTGIPGPTGDLEALWAFQLTRAPRENGEGGTVHAIDLETGESVWRFGTGNTVCGEPAIAYGRLYFASRDGRVYCFEPAAVGQPSLPQAIDQSPRPVDAAEKAAALLAEAKAAANDTADWPMQGRDARRGSRAAIKLGDALEPAWSLATKGRIVTSPAVENGRVFVSSLAGTLTAADLVTGETLWAHHFGAPSSCSPAVSGDLVYCGADDGTFAALSVRDGRVKWTYRAGAPIQASPAIEGGLIVFGAHDHNIYALNRHTGEKLWNFTARGAFVQAPPVIADGRVYAAQWHDWVWALDLQTGEPLWRSFVPISIEAVARHGDHLYVRSPYYVLELEPATGRRLRIGSASYGYGGLAFHETSLFQSGIKGQYGTSSLTRIDLDAPTLPPAKYPTIDDVPRFSPKSLPLRLTSMSAPLAGADDRLCVATRQGELILTDLEGRVLWEHNLGAKIHGVPIAASGMVFVGADDGRLRAFRTGTAK